MITEHGLAAWNRAAVEAAIEWERVLMEAAAVGVELDIAAIRAEYAESPDPLTTMATIARRHIADFSRGDEPGGEIATFRRDHPDWADMPAEHIERTFVFACWRLSRTMSDLGVELGRDPLFRRLEETMLRLGEWIVDYLPPSIRRRLGRQRTTTDSYYQTQDYQRDGTDGGVGATIDDLIDNIDQILAEHKSE